MIIFKQIESFQRSCANPFAFGIKTINEKHYIITEISFDTKNKKGRVMKIGFRIPSVTKRIAARTSVQRVIRHNFGFKAPKGMGWVTDPKKALYNRVYTRTSRGCLVLFLGLFGFFVFSLWLLLELI